MPSSLIVVGLVVAWLVVLVPIVARKRADARSSMEEEYDAMPDAEFEDDEFDDEYEEIRPYRPGRGGYDPETAAVAAQAKYAFRRRVVAFLLVAALATGLLAGLLYPLAWWGHAGVDLALVGYLAYLRRQVRMEEEIRARRQARLTQPRRRPAARPVEEESESALEPQPRFRHQVRPGTVVVDMDDEDPAFDELDGPDALPYRRASGE
ncbi:gephyrin-like molybdotransferase receptor GlpR [Actinosynnema sp. NPDC020468]|uniref:divisome protein SepX/GlpR n=1 Tax=Actinosynnema sp. NPDC020468 TaxID=3154488 RepID=UPI003408CF3D